MAQQSKSGKQERSRTWKPLFGKATHTESEREGTNDSDFISLLPQRLGPQLQDQEAAALTTELQSHLVTLRTCDSNTLLHVNSDQGQGLEAKAIRLWNLVTRLGREQDTTVERSNNRIQVDFLVRIFAFYLLDNIARAQRDHVSLRKRSAEDVWKDTSRLLSIALKTAKACISQNIDYTPKVLERAADYQDVLDKLAAAEAKTSEDNTGLLAVCRNQKMRYFGLRMTWAWRQGNLDLAKMMFDQCSGLAIAVDCSDREELADLTFEVGRNLIKEEDYSSAAKWLQRSSHILEQMQPEALSSDAVELRLSIARHLVRAYLNLKTDAARQKAQNLLQQMDNEFAGKLVLMILRLDLILNMQSFDAEQYFNVLSRIIRTVHLTGTNFKMVIHFVRKLKEHNSDLACKILDDLVILRLLDTSPDHVEWTQKAFVTRLWASIAPSIESLSQVMTAIHNAWRRSVPTRVTQAAHTLLWRRIDMCFQAEDWDQADAWVRLTLHPLLENAGDVNVTKISRKVIACSLARDDLERAWSTFNQMPAIGRDEPLTRYLMYKVSLRSKDDTVMAECLEAVARHASRDPSLLYACVLEAQGSGNRQAAITALHAIIARCKIHGLPGAHLPSVFRCSIKLLIGDLLSATPLEQTDQHQICGTFQAAVDIMKKQQHTTNTGQCPRFDARELDWLFINSYNLALEYFSEWSPEMLRRLFECCRSFLDYRDLEAAIEQGPIRRSHRLACYSLAAQNLLKIARAEKDEKSRLACYHESRRYIQEFCETLEQTSDQSIDSFSQQQIFRRLAITDVEAIIRLKAWAELNPAISRCATLNDQKVYAVLADMVLASKANTEIILHTLQHIINTSTSVGHHLPLPKQSRWYRILYQLSQKQAHEATDRSSAARVSDAIIEQVLRVLQIPLDTREGEGYPAEELEYLVIATYNRAIDAHVAENDAECLRLGELAKHLAGHMSDEGVLLKTIKDNLETLRAADGEDVDDDDEEVGGEYADADAMGPVDVED